jgi:hypothetical protein
MKARAIALVVAPLALGTACVHSGQTAATPSGEQQAAVAAGAPAGASTGAPAARDPLMQPGLEIQGHGSDQIVAGRIAEASGSQVIIQTQQGDARTLQIVPETMIQLDGQDAASGDLAEGQAVRASFDVVEGQEVAVKIRAGASAAAASDATSTGQGTGSSATDQGTGSSDQATPHGPENATPDAGWGPPGSSGNPAPPASPHW